MIKLNLTERIEKNHKDFVDGKINYLPFEPLGEFTNWFPGLMREELTCFTGTPASSKTSLVKKLIIHDGIKWAVKNKVNFHVLYFGLEESRNQFLYSLLSHQAYLMHGLQYNIKDFESIGRTIDLNHLSLLKESEQRVEKMLPYISYYSNIYNSFGIWKAVRDFAANRGTFLFNGNPVDLIDKNNSWDSYIPNDPEEFIVVVVDHLLLLSHQQNEKDQAEAIWNVIEDLRRYAANKLRYAIVPIHHQNSDSENQESRREQNILPTENGLARNKEVARSYLNLIGIANPNKVNAAGVNPSLRVWNGHDLTIFGNYIRTINILKSRYGESNVSDSVFFAGRTGYFTTIPKVGDSNYRKFTDNIKNFK